MRDTTERPKIEDFKIFLPLFFNCLYAHISNLNYKKYLDIKKNRFRAFQGTEPPNIYNFYAL